MAASSSRAPERRSSSPQGRLFAVHRTIKPSRDKSNEKIGGVVAWCDALFVWSLAEQPEEEEEEEEEESVYKSDPRRILI